MSLLDDVSIVVTPNGYKAGTLYGVLPSSGAADMDVTRATAATRVDESGLIEDVLANVPRIDYTGGGCPHILAEPQRTNEVTYSSDFSNSYFQKIRSTISTDQIISPDGTQNADKFIEDSALGTKLLWTQDKVVSIGDVLTWSVFAKKGERDWIVLREANAGNFSAYFDLTNGVIGTSEGVDSSKIEDYGSGWYRCSITYTTTGTTAKGRLYLADSDNGQSYQGNGTSGLYIWGAQLEEGSYATSYIPTSGSAVTRNQDLFTRDGIGSLINSTSGSFFIEMAALNQPPGSQISISLSGNNSSDRLLIYASGSGGKWLAQFRKNGVNIVSIERTTTLTNQSKVAVSWEAGRYVMYIDGNKATNYGSGGSETFPTTFDVGDLKNLQFTPNHNSTSNLFFGKVKQLQVYKTALTDEQLLQLTGESGTDFYESYAGMASALTYTIQ